MSNEVLRLRPPELVASLVPSLEMSMRRRPLGDKVSNEVLWTYQGHRCTSGPEGGASLTMTLPVTDRQLGR